MAKKSRDITTREPKNYSRYYDAARDTSEHYFPTVTNTISNFSRTIRDVDNWVKTSTPFRKSPQGTSGEKKIFSIANDLLREAGRDLREGNILSFKNLNNKINDLFNGMGDKGFDDSYDAEYDTDGSGDSASYGGFDSELYMQGTAISTQATIDAVSTATESITSSQLRASDYSAKRIVSGTNVAISRVLKFQAMNADIMSTINQNMQTLIEASSKQDAYQQQALSFFQRSENYFNDIITLMREQADPVAARESERGRYKGGPRKGNQFLENGFDPGAFFKSIWDNSPLAMLAKMGLSTAEPYLKMAGIDVSKLTEGGLGAVGSFDGIRPLRMLFEATPMAKQLHKMNDDFENNLKLLFHRLGQGSYGGILGDISSLGLFGDYQLGKRGGIDLGNYDKGVAKLTGKTLKSIEVVVPTYLSNIENDIAALLEGFSTGQFEIGTFKSRNKYTAREREANKAYFEEMRSRKHRNVYDLEEGRFRNASEFEADFQDEYNSNFTRNYSPLMDNISAMMAKRGDAEREAMNKVLNDMIEEYGNDRNIRADKKSRDVFINTIKGLGIDTTLFASEDAMNHALEDLFNQFILAQDKYQRDRADLLERVSTESGVEANLFNTSKDKWKNDDRFRARTNKIKNPTLNVGKLKGTTARKTYDAATNGMVSKRYDFGAGINDRINQYREHLETGVSLGSTDPRQLEDFDKLMAYYADMKDPRNTPDQLKYKKKEYDKWRRHYKMAWGDPPTDEEKNEWLSYYGKTDKLKSPGGIIKKEIYSGHHASYVGHAQNKVIWGGNVDENAQSSYLAEYNAMVGSSASTPTPQPVVQTNSASAQQTPQPVAQPQSSATASQPTIQPATTAGSASSGRAALTVNRSQVENFIRSRNAAATEGNDEGTSSSEANENPQPESSSSSATPLNEFTTGAATTAGSASAGDDAAANVPRLKGSLDIAGYIKNLANDGVKRAKDWTSQKKEVLMELLSNSRILAGNAENQRVKLFGTGGVFSAGIKKFLTGFDFVKKLLLGEKDPKTGYYTGGWIPPKYANKLVDAKKAAKNYLFGEGYTDYDGNEHEAKEDYIMKPVQEATREMHRGVITSVFGEDYKSNEKYQKLFNMFKLKEDQEIHLPRAWTGDVGDNGIAVDTYDYSKWNPTPHSGAQLIGWMFDSVEGWEFHYIHLDKHQTMKPSAAWAESSQDPAVLPTVSATEEILNAINKLPSAEELKPKTFKVRGMKFSKPQTVGGTEGEAANSAQAPAGPIADAEANINQPDNAAVLTPPENNAHLDESIDEYDDEDDEALGYDDLPTVFEDQMMDMEDTVDMGFRSVIDRLDSILDRMIGAPPSDASRTIINGQDIANTVQTPHDITSSPADVNTSSAIDNVDVEDIDEGEPEIYEDVNADSDSVNNHQPENVTQVETVDVGSASTTENQPIETADVTGGEAQQPETVANSAQAPSGETIEEVNAGSTTGNNRKRKIKFNGVQGRIKTIQNKRKNGGQYLPEDFDLALQRDESTNYFWYNGRRAIRKTYTEYHDAKNSTTRNFAYYEDENAPNKLGEYIGEDVQADLHSSAEYNQGVVDRYNEEQANAPKARIARGVQTAAILKLGPNPARTIAATALGFALGGGPGGAAAAFLITKAGEAMINKAKDNGKLFDHDGSPKPDKKSGIGKAIAGFVKGLPSFVVGIGGALVGALLGGGLPGAAIGFMIGNSTFKKSGLHDVLFGSGKKDGPGGIPRLFGTAVKGIFGVGKSVAGGLFHGVMGARKALNENTQNSGKIAPLIGTLIGLGLGGVPGALIGRAGGKIIGQIGHSIFGGGDNAGYGEGEAPDAPNDFERQTAAEPTQEPTRSSSIAELQLPDEEEESEGRGPEEPYDLNNAVEVVETQTVDIVDAINTGIDRVVNRMDYLDGVEVSRKEKAAYDEKERQETDWAQSAGKHKDEAPVTAAHADYDAEREPEKKTGILDTLKGLFSGGGLLDILKVALPIGAAAWLLDAFFKTDVGAALKEKGVKLLEGIGTIVENGKNLLIGVADGINKVLGGVDALTNKGIGMGALGTLKTNLSTKNPDGTDKSDFIMKAAGIQTDSYIDEETGEVVTTHSFDAAKVDGNLVKGVLTGGAQKTVWLFLEKFTPKLAELLKAAGSKLKNIGTYAAARISEEVEKKLGPMLSKANGKLVSFMEKNFPTVWKFFSGLHVSPEVLSKIAFGTYGALKGLSNYGVSDLFGIDSGFADWAMRAISALLETVCWVTTFGAIVDFILWLIRAATGIDLKKLLATWIYEVLMKDDPNAINKLKFAQGDFQNRLQMYNELTDSVGGETLSEDEFTKATEYSVFDSIYENSIGKVKSLFGYDARSAHAKEVDANRAYLNAAEVAAMQKESQYTNMSVEDMTAENEGYGSGRSVGYGVSDSTHYSQLDNAWKNLAFGKMVNGRSTTIGSGGCGPTALATVARSVTGNKHITPSTVANMAQDYGYTANGGSSASLFTEGASRLGLSSQRISTNDIPSRLATGQKIIISGKKKGSNSLYTNAGHIISVSGIKNGKAVVDDPLKSKSETRDVRDVLNGAKKAWAIGGGSMGYGRLDDYISNMESMGYGFNENGELIDFVHAGADGYKYKAWHDGLSFGDLVNVEHNGGDHIGIYFQQGNWGSGYAAESANSWSSKAFGSDTYADSGCFPTAFASVLSSVTRTDIDPPLVIKKFGNHWSGSSYNWTAYEDMLNMLYGGAGAAAVGDQLLDTGFTDSHRDIGNPWRPSGYNNMSNADQINEAMKRVTLTLKGGGGVWIDGTGAANVFNGKNRSGHAIAMYGFSEGDQLSGELHDKYEGGAYTTILDPGRSKSSGAGVVRFPLSSLRADLNNGHTKRITTFPKPKVNEEQLVSQVKDAMSPFSTDYTTRKGSGGSIVIGGSDATGGNSASTTTSSTSESSGASFDSSASDVGNRYNGYQYADQLADDDSFMGKLGNLMSIIGGIAGNILQTLSGEKYQSVFGHYTSNGGGGLNNDWNLVTGSSHTPRYITVKQDTLGQAAFLDVGDLNFSDNAVLTSVAEDVTRYWVDKIREKTPNPSYDEDPARYKTMVDGYKRSIYDSWKNQEFVDGHYYKVSGFGGKQALIPAWYTKENVLNYMREEWPESEVIAGWKSKDSKNGTSVYAKKDGETDAEYNARLHDKYESILNDIYNRDIEGRNSPNGGSHGVSMYDVTGVKYTENDINTGTIRLGNNVIDIDGNISNDMSEENEIIDTEAPDSSEDFTDENGVAEVGQGGALSNLLKPRVRDKDDGESVQAELINGLTKEQLDNAAIITPTLISGRSVGSMPEYATKSAGYSAYTETPPQSSKLSPAVVAEMGDYVIPMQQKHESGNDPSSVVYLAGESNYTVGTGWYNNNAAEVLGRIGNAPQLSDAQRQAARNYAEIINRHGRLSTSDLKTFLRSDGVSEVNEKVQRAMHQQLNNYTLAAPIRRFDEGRIRDPRGVMQMVEFSGIAPNTVAKLTNFGDGSMNGVAGALKTMTSGFSNYGTYGKGWANRIDETRDTLASATDYSSELKNAIKSAGYGESVGYGDPTLSSLAYGEDVDLTQNDTFNRMLGNTSQGFGKIDNSNYSNNHNRSSMSISSTREYSPTINSDSHAKNEIDVNVDLNKLESGTYQMVSLLKTIADNTRIAAKNKPSNNTTTINNIREAPTTTNNIGYGDPSTKTEVPKVGVGRQKINNVHTDKMRKFHDIVAKSPRAY